MKRGALLQTQRAAEKGCFIKGIGQVQQLSPGEGRGAPDVRDRPVMTESGTRLGRVTDYDVDEASGRVERYHVATGGFFGRLTHREIAFPPAAVRAFGPDAIVVADEVCRPPGEAAGKVVP